MNKKIKKVCLMSIKPKYYKLIKEGVKKVEFRKVAPKGISLIYLYVSSPIQKICGYFEVEKIDCNTKENIWVQTSDISGLTKEELFQYVGTKGNVSAIYIKTFHPIKPQNPAEIIENFTVPQNYIYVAHEKFSTLVSTKK